MPSFFVRKLVMHPIPRNMRAISAYIAAVSIAGAVVLLWSVLNPGDMTFRSETTFWLFLLATMFGELRPIRSPIGQEGVEFTVSTTFAFAILLTSGLLPALLTLSLATLLADLLAHKAWWKALFNSSQYILAIAAAAATLHLVSDLPRHSGPMLFSQPSDFLGVVAAAVVFFIVNGTVTDIALAIVQRLRVLTVLREDIAFQATSNVALLGLAPVVVVAAERSIWLLPALLMPLVVAYRAALVSAEKEHQSTHDSLTGLPNRSLFQDRAKRAITAAASTNRRAGLILLDLDRFKEINDTLGHHTGDLLLQRLGPRLQEAVREGDTVARLGGTSSGSFSPTCPMRRLHSRWRTGSTRPCTSRSTSATWCSMSRAASASRCTRTTARTSTR